MNFNKIKVERNDLMQTPPAMISTKDLTYIEDMANWTYTLSKKAEHFANEVVDSDLKNGFQSLAAKLKLHYKILLSVLGGTNESE